MSLIPKIKIEITIGQLEAVIDAFQCLTLTPFNNRKLLVARNIIDLLSIKLLKKMISKRHEKKPFTMSFEYYEAHYLEEFLLTVTRLEPNHDQQSVINKLNQKLA